MHFIDYVIALQVELCDATISLKRLNWGACIEDIILVEADFAVFHRYLAEESVLRSRVECHD